MANYLLSDIAKEDPFKIYRYGVKQFVAEQADRYYFRFFERFDQIALQPFLFPEVAYIRQGYRRCPCGSDSIYYRVTDDHVEVMRIIGRQNFEEKKT